MIATDANVTHQALIEEFQNATGTDFDYLDSFVHKSLRGGVQWRLIILFIDRQNDGVPAQFHQSIRHQSYAVDTHQIGRWPVGVYDDEVFQASSICSTN